MLKKTHTWVISYMYKSHICISLSCILVSGTHNQCHAHINSIDFKLKCTEEDNQRG